MKNNSRGQALIEYILILSLFAVISIGIARIMNEMVNDMVTQLTTVLSQHLSVGVCEKAVSSMVTGIRSNECSIIYIYLHHYYFRICLLPRFKVSKNPKPLAVFKYN